jgi:hypothetical protein
MPGEAAWKEWDETFSIGVKNEKKIKWYMYSQFVNVCLYKDVDKMTVIKAYKNPITKHQ